MSANIPTTPPAVKGKMQTKASMGSLDTRKQHPSLKARMSADDSDAVLMSDQKLGGGIRQTGSLK
jgi:hypothetical protein